MYYQSTNYTPYSTTIGTPKTTFYYHKNNDGNGKVTYTPTPNILGLLFPPIAPITPSTTPYSGLTKSNEYYYSPTGSDSVITTDTIVYNNPFFPYTTKTINYNTPVSGLPYSTIPPIGLVYPDINNDRSTIDSVVDYFYKLTFNKWIYGELSELFNYFYVKTDGSIDILNDISDYKADSHKRLSSKEKDNIIDYIKTYFLTKSTLERILSNYCKETSTKWYNLAKYNFNVRPLIGEKVAKLIKKAIEVGKK